jgi:CRP-like cAMP-binding protein
VGDTAYIIIDGEADVLVDTPTGELAVGKLKQNDLVGEIAILINIPRTATVRADSELTTLAISKDQFFNMIREFPDMAIEIMRELAERLEQTTSDLRAALSDS